MPLNLQDGTTLYIPSSMLERKSSICAGISSGLPSVFPVPKHCTSRNSSRIACTKEAFFCPSGTRCRISLARLWLGSSSFGRNEKTGRSPRPHLHHDPFISGSVGIYVCQVNRPENPVLRGHVPFYDGRPAAHEDAGYRPQVKPGFHDGRQDFFRIVPSVPLDDLPGFFVKAADTSV